MNTAHNYERALLECDIETLHRIILTRHEDHGTLEGIIARRIAAIPRLPLSRDGRWWHFSNAHAYPFGN